MLAKASHAWYHAADAYKDDSTVVFGDVIISDAKELVANITKRRKQAHDFEIEFLKAAEKNPQELPELHEGGEPEPSTIFESELEDMDYMYADHWHVEPSEEAQAGAHARLCLPPMVLRQFLIGRNLAKFKLPDELMLVSNLPKTAVGKVDKKAILGTSGAS